MRLKRFEFELFQKFFPSENPRQNLLSQMKIFSIFRQKSQHLLIQLKYSVNPPSPQVNVVCLDSGDVLHDFFRVTEINNIDLGGGGGKGGHLLFRSTFFRFVTRVLARIVAFIQIACLNGTNYVRKLELHHQLLSSRKSCCRKLAPLLSLTLEFMTQ